MSVTVHEMSNTDLDAVVEIERLVQFNPWSRSAFAECLKPVFKCVVARDVVAGGVVAGNNEQVIGYGIVSVAVAETELLNLAVAPDYHRQGHGRYILQHLIELLRDSADGIFLEVRESNQSAIRLYESMGFRRCGQRRNYYPAPGGREAALIYKRKLS